MTAQTTLFRRVPNTKMSVVVRLPLVSQRREYNPNTLGLISGPHRLFLVLLVPKFATALGKRRIGRLIAWYWSAEPECVYMESK